MTPEALVGHFRNAKKVGVDRWIVSASTREDKHPSVAISVKPDGRILLHDFGGDSVEDILEAAGLDMTALFPEKPYAGLYNHHKVERRPFNPHDVLACLALETAIALDCANQLRAGKALSPDDHARLVTACGRLVAGMDIANGQ